MSTAICDTDGNIYDIQPNVDDAMNIAEVIASITGHDVVVSDATEIQIPSEIGVVISNN